jgi:hypothetical protein
LNPFKNRRYCPRVLVNDSSKTFWEYSRYIICKTTSCDVGYSFNSSLANNINNLWQQLVLVIMAFLQSNNATLNFHYEITCFTYITVGAIRASPSEIAPPGS